MEERDELEGLNYEKVVLDHNAHKLIGKVTKQQSGKEADVEIPDGAVWLVTGLGHLKADTPEELIEGSLGDIVIVSKAQLTEFVKQKSKEYMLNELIKAEFLKEPGEDPEDPRGNGEFTFYLKNIRKILDDRHGPEYSGKDGDLICEHFTITSLIKFFENL